MVTLPPKLVSGFIEPRLSVSVARQIIDFYGRDESTTIWITFARKKLYWGLSEPDGVLYTDKRRFTYKKLLNGWFDYSLSDSENLLTFENVSGVLLKTQGYRETICEIKNRTGESFN